MRVFEKNKCKKKCKVESICTLQMYLQMNIRSYGNNFLK